MLLRDRIERILREVLELEGDDRGGLHWHGPNGPTNERAGDLGDLATDLAAALEKEMVWPPPLYPTDSAFAAIEAAKANGLLKRHGDEADVPAIREGRE